MSHQKKGPEKYAVYTLQRMPCCILEVPLSQRETVRYLERQGMAKYSAETGEWTRTKKGDAFLKNSPNAGRSDSSRGSGRKRPANRRVREPKQNPPGATFGGTSRLLRKHRDAGEEFYERHLDSHP